MIGFLVAFGLTIFAICVVVGVSRKKTNKSGQVLYQKVISKEEPLEFEIAGLYYRSTEAHKIARGLGVGTQLRYELEPNNEYDKYAVKIIYKGIHLGYIPTVYSELIFNQLNNGNNCIIEVISNDKGAIPHVFVKLFPGNSNQVEEKAIIKSPEPPKDILDGVDVEKYIKHIAEKLLYSEHGYLLNSTDETLSLDLNKKDTLLGEAAELVVSHQSGSTSLIQRKFSIGYNRAGRLMDQLEAVGIVGPAQGSVPREVYIMDTYTLQEKLSNINEYFNIDKILETVEERYYDKIQIRKEFMLDLILKEEEIERLQKEDEEKQAIRDKLLDKERKKQLEKKIRQDLIDEGLIEE